MEVSTSDTMPNATNRWNTLSIGFFCCDECGECKLLLLVVLVLVLVLVLWLLWILRRTFIAAEVVWVLVSGHNGLLCLLLLCCDVVLFTFSCGQCPFVVVVGRNPSLTLGGPAHIFTTTAVQIAKNTTPIKKIVNRQLTSLHDQIWQVFLQPDRFARCDRTYYYVPTSFCLHECRMTHRKRSLSSSPNPTLLPKSVLSNTLASGVINSAIS